MVANYNDLLRSKMTGLKYYGEEIYKISDNLKIIVNQSAFSDNVDYLYIQKSVSTGLSKIGNNLALYLDKIDIYEDIEILLYKLPVNSTYLDMAKKYREYMLSDGKCRTIKEKIKSRPELEQIRDSIEIRIRMAWKPAPADVMEQTEENEPPIFVACTFDRVKEFVKRLKESGLETGKVFLAHCWNESGAKKLANMIREALPEVTVKIGINLGLCSYYAEKGGILVGYEI